MSDARRGTVAEGGDYGERLRDVNEALLVSSVRQHELTAQAEQAGAALRESERQLGWEVSALNRLHELNARLMLARDLPSVLTETLHAAAALLGSDFGSTQLFDPETNCLTLVAHRGFKPKVADYYRTVALEHGSPCALALQQGERIVVEDMSTDPRFEPDHAIVRLAGWRGVQSTPLVGRDGRLIGIISTHFRRPHRPSERELRILDLYVRQATDLIERLRTEAALRESEQRYRTLFTSIDEGFCVIEMLFDDGLPVDYRFLVVNPAFEAQSGMHDVRGRRMREFVPSIEQHWLVNYGQVALTGEPIRFSNEYKSLHRWFDVYAFRVGGPESRRVAVLFTDITERKRADEALKEADRRKDEFLATLAHELRNPLAPISHAVEMLELVGHDAEQVEALRATMNRQLRQMVRLIDDLLDVSRISRGAIALQKQRIDFPSIIASAVEAARPAIDEAEHQLSVEESGKRLTLDADPVRIAQVVTNLLTNAARYTPHGGHIRLSTARDGDAAVIRVRDDGVGIPEARLVDIFEMFSQVDRALESSRSGLGIGLTLVKRLVELHGGTVTVHSDGLGTGSEFVVRLPLAPDEPADRPAAPPPHLARPNHVAYRVLVVEDSKPVADMFAAMLRMLGHEVELAPSGEKALERIGDVRPDVVFSDISMPGMSGYTLAQRLREQPEWSGVELVATTGYGQPEDRERALRAGFDQHLVKPASLDELQTLFDSLPARDQAPHNSAGR